MFLEIAFFCGCCDFNGPSRHQAEIVHRLVIPVFDSRDIQLVTLHTKDGNANSICSNCVQFLNTSQSYSEIIHLHLQHHQMQTCNMLLNVFGHLIPILLLVSLFKTHMSKPRMALSFWINK